MKPDRSNYRQILMPGLLILVLAMCTACGTKIVRGASPMVRMTEMSHLDNMITLQISIRNLNGVEMDVQSIDFSLLASDELLFSYRGPINTNIVANGTEAWSVEVEESENSKALLDKLQNGEVKSLPYSLEGSILTREDGNLSFEYEGHIYPLPGRPGYFR